MDNDDNIRRPDPILVDRLIDDDDVTHFEPNPNFYEQDINAILEMSKNEFNLQQDEEEMKAIELSYKEMKEQQEKERLNKFNNLKIQMNKLILIDKSQINYYQLILTIIEMYETNIINEYNIAIDEYTNIFNIIKTIRLPPNEIEYLKKIIVSE